MFREDIMGKIERYDVNDEWAHAGLFSSRWIA